jgi:DNA topoisomerase-1
MRQLIHNSILVPHYEWKKIHIKIKGSEVELNPQQEEMAVAWVRKLGTDYVNDKVFVKNFFNDFCKALGLKETLDPGVFDFSAIIGYVEGEKTKKLSLSKTEKKQQTEERKKQREAFKEKYGYATVDSIRTEISNYTAEPSCIFMGRGKHPLRGSWKQGPQEEDIELNISDASQLQGNWKHIWQPEVMWIARWMDKLSQKMKYVWLAENSALKQAKEIGKFEKAKELQRNIERIENHIAENLDSTDLKRRKTATVCFLIDMLKIRVGDEKDPDEADTVGASTLRPEHVHFNDDGKVTFNFLGKDSVPHVFVEELPENVVRNLKEFSSNTQSTLFNGVDSSRVSEFLGEVVHGLSAKVFRTYYASCAVEGKLEDAPVKVENPDYIKRFTATIANLEAAKTCNHKRTIPKTWESSLQRQEERHKSLVDKVKMSQAKIQKQVKDLEQKFESLLKKEVERLNTLQQTLGLLQNQLNIETVEGKVTTNLTKRVTKQRTTIAEQRARIKRIRERHIEQVKKIKERNEERQKREKATIEKSKLQIDTKRQTRDFNLGTSLKSYIDPRIYYDWGKKVDYDWKLYYPKALQKKFSWVETDSANKPD